MLELDSSYLSGYGPHTPEEVKNTPPEFATVPQSPGSQPAGVWSSALAKYRFSL